METIKNYLEAMFASMPNTPEVRKAKSELLTMMEDKYNEMIAEGINENTAVGTVISEFGNLDELAEDLGLSKEVEEVKERTQDNKRRFVSLDEVKGYLGSEVKSAWMVGIAVLLFITSVIYPILGDIVRVNEGLMVGLMFLSIAIGVGLCVYNGIYCAEWDFLKKENCTIDLATAEYVKERRRSFKPTYALCHTIGVMLCVICWVPAAIFDGSEAAVPFLFIFVGIGVLMIIYSSTIYGSYEKILSVNDRATISGNYGKDEDQITYINETSSKVMELYWPTVTCIYLMISFLTFSWGTTWIIWPIAAILRKILMVSLAKEDDYE